MITMEREGFMASKVKKLRPMDIKVELIKPKRNPIWMYTSMEKHRNGLTGEEKMYALFYVAFFILIFYLIIKYG